MIRASLLLFALAVGCSTRGGIEVEVTSGPTVSNVDHFHVGITDSIGRVATSDIPLSQGAVIPPPQYFALEFDSGFSGEVTLSLTAVDPAGTILATAANATATVSEGDLISIILSLGEFADLGVDAALDASPPDLNATADMSALDLFVPSDLMPDLNTPPDLTTPPDLSPCSGTMTLTIGAVGFTGICPGSSVNIPYLVSGCVHPANTFVAQLSGPSGAFASAVDIGAISSSISGTISATIPLGAMAGSGYRIRIHASAPVTNSSDNGADLQVFALPDSSFTFSPHNLTTEGQVTFTPTASSGTFSWNFGADATPTTSTSSAPMVGYSMAGGKVTSLTVTNSNGCHTTSTVAPTGGASANPNPFDTGVEVFSCDPAVPATATVVNTNVTGSATINWICGGATDTQSGGTVTSFVEPGGALSYGGSGQYLVYLQSGGTFTGAAGGTTFLVYESGATMTGNIGGSVMCSSLIYDYSVAPSPGCF